MQTGVPIINWQSLKIFALFAILIGMVFISVSVCAQTVSVGDGPPKAPQEAIKELERHIQRLYRRKAAPLESDKAIPASEQTAMQLREGKKSAPESSAVPADKSHTDTTAQQSTALISNPQIHYTENVYSGGIMRSLLITIGVACICGALILVLGSILLFGNREH